MGVTGIIISAAVLLVWHDFGLYRTNGCYLYAGESRNKNQTLKKTQGT